MTRWTLFLTTLFLLPLPFGSDVLWAWVPAAAMVFGLLAAELRALPVTTEGQLKLPESLVHARWLILLLGLVQLWAAVQSVLFSLSPYDSFLACIKGLTYTGVFCLTLFMANSRHRVRQLIWIMVFAATFQALFGSIMVLSGLELGFFSFKERHLGVATGTYLNRNHLAGLMELVLAMGIGLLMARPTEYIGSMRHRIKQFLEVLLSNKVILRLLLIIMVIALVMSRSRSGNTAFFVSLMVTGLLALLLMRRKTLGTTILLGSLLIIDIAIVGTFFGVEKVAERIQQTSAEHESRDEVTRDTLSLWQSEPVTGIGPGAFIATFPAFKGADITSDRYYNNAHNDYAQFLVEFGLPGFILLCMVGGTALWWAMTAMRQRRSRFFQGLGFGCTMAMIAYLVHSATDFNLQIPANAAFFSIILALAVIARWMPNVRPQENYRSEAGS